MHLMKCITQTICKAFHTGHATPYLQSSSMFACVPKRHKGAITLSLPPEGPHLATLSLLKATKANSMYKRPAFPHSSKKAISMIMKASS